MFLFSKKNKTIEAVPKSERLVLADDNRTKLTLGTGDLRVAVKLPIGEDLNEWIACNTADFFSEITLLWGLVLDGTDENIILNSELGVGFPHGIEYRWADADKSKTPIKCNGPTYCEFVLTWVEKELNNDKMFPKSSDQTFPKQPIFLAQIKIIYTKLFRIFAIIYSHHFMTLEKMGAVAHLNTW
jgi:MOB kinase activator 1